MLRAAVTRGTDRKQKIARTPRTLTTSAPKLRALASSALNPGDGDFERHLRTNFEVPEVFLQRENSSCITIGALMGLPAMDGMSDSRDPQFYLTTGHQKRSAFKKSRTSYSQGLTVPWYWSTTSGWQ